jgi:hypothetical protein
LSWLAANPLPQSVRYFSLAALTKRNNINTLLKTGYDLLWIYSPRNDGLLLMSINLFPGERFSAMPTPTTGRWRCPWKIKIPDIRNDSGTTTISPQGFAAGIADLCR